MLTHTCRNTAGKFLYIYMHFVIFLTVALTWLFEYAFFLFLSQTQMDLIRQHCSAHWTHRFWYRMALQCLRLVSLRNVYRCDISLHSGCCSRPFSPTHLVWPRSTTFIRCGILYLCKRWPVFAKRPVGQALLLWSVDGLADRNVDWFLAFGIVIHRSAILWAHWLQRIMWKAIGPIRSWCPHWQWALLDSSCSYFWSIHPISLAVKNKRQYRRYQRGARAPHRIVNIDRSKPVLIKWTKNKI